MQLEQRQPLEIRVTDIDLGRLAGISWRDTQGICCQIAALFMLAMMMLPDLSNTTTEELLSPY